MPETLNYILFLVSLLVLSLGQTCLAFQQVVHLHVDLFNFKCVKPCPSPQRCRILNTKPEKMTGKKRGGLVIHCRDSRVPQFN